MQVFTSEERTRLRHAVIVVLTAITFSTVSFLLLDGDSQLKSFDFLPELMRFALAMSLLYGSIIALAVASWVTLYNGAFFISRIVSGSR